MAGVPEQDWAAPGQLHEIVQIGVLRPHEDFSVHEEFTPPTKGRQVMPTGSIAVPAEGHNRR